MRRSTLLFALGLPIMLTGWTACGDDDVTPPPGPHDLTFAGDATFQAPHGGQVVYVVVEDAQGMPVASENGSVSAEDDPAFSFTFPGLLAGGADYFVKYWIDSNFSEEGTEGVCDPREIDHQWSVEVADVSGDVELTEVHDAQQTTAVCDAFAFDLAFSGDASFQDAHGGDSIHVAVVRTGSGVPGGDLLVARTRGTVSADQDPSFSFDFPGVLVRDLEYDLDYWIDSNFSGGSEGTCDPPENDHQWRLSFGPVSEDETIEDTHRPGETESVCSTFE